MYDKTWKNICKYMIKLAKIFEIFLKEIFWQNQVLDSNNASLCQPCYIILLEAVLDIIRNRFYVASFIMLTLLGIKKLD